MSIPQIYYLDSASLSGATSAYMDDQLTLCAPDGFYSDGVITREILRVDGTFGSPRETFEIEFIDQSVRTLKNYSGLGFNTVGQAGLRTRLCMTCFSSVYAMI